MLNDNTWDNLAKARFERSLVMQSYMQKLGNGISHLVAMVSEVISTWVGKRETIRLLTTLSDAQLKDVGLVRHDVERLVKSLSPKI